MKNEDVIKAFIHREIAKSNSGNVLSTGNKLYSYRTCIAEYNDGNLYVNLTKYSITTSRHQSLLLRNVQNYIPVQNIREGSRNLIK